MTLIKPSQEFPQESLIIGGHGPLELVHLSHILPQQLYVESIFTPIKKKNKTTLIVNSKKHTLYPQNALVELTIKRGRSEYESQGCLYAHDQTSPFTFEAKDTLYIEKFETFSGTKVEEDEPQPYQGLFTPENLETCGQSRFQILQDTLQILEPTVEHSLGYKIRTGGLTLNLVLEEMSFPYHSRFYERYAATSNTFILVFVPAWSTVGPQIL